MNQQNGTLVQTFYQIDNELRNQLSHHRATLYIQQNPMPPNVVQANHQASQELRDLEHYVEHAVVQKRSLEYEIFVADTCGDRIDRPVLLWAFEPIMEYKARVAFDLLKLSTVMKDRLRQLVLSEADSGLLRQQLINELDQAWTTNTNLIYGLIAAARGINPLSALADQIYAALEESGIHQAMVSS